jgi:hypothetical protein
MMSRGGSGNNVLMWQKVGVMQNSFRQLIERPSGSAIRSLIFFVLFYLYLWLDVDLRLIYHGGGVITNFPVFYRGWEFFRPFLSYPGGPVEYLSAFLAQLFYYSWAGAIVVTAVAWLFCVCTDFFFRAVGAFRLVWVRFVGPVLLLAIYTQYTFHFVTTAALLTALVFVCLYLKVVPKDKSAAFVVFLVLSVVLYYLAGGAYLLFAVLCALYELLFARRRQGLLYLLLAAVIPYVEGVLLFQASTIDAFSSLLPFSGRVISLEIRKRMLIMVYVLYLLLPLSVFGLWVWQVLLKAKTRKLHTGFSRLLSAIHFWNADVASYRWIVDSLVLFMFTGVAVFVFHDKKEKAFFAVDYYACHKMWPQVLAAAQHNPNSCFVVHAVNRALYHTGRLGYDMFAWSQHPDVMFLNISQDRELACWRKFDVFIDLGIMNMAEDNLAESLEVSGQRPLLLKRLAMVNMVKGNIGAARIYLSALSKTLFYSGWANDYLDKLTADSYLSADETVEYFRGIMMDKDYDFRSCPPRKILLELLAKSRQNRMAFEYLMTLYLLSGQFEDFVKNLDRLDDFKYAEIPRLYEEAMLLYIYHTKRTLEPYSRRISLESFQRFEGFKQVLSNYGGNKTTAFSELAKHYGDSYFFYYLYGVSGVRK